MLDPLSLVTLGLLAGAGLAETGRRLSNSFAKPSTRPVKAGEIMAFALKGCRQCAGTGQFVRYVPPRPAALGTSGIVQGAGTRTAHLCACAVRRFAKAHPAIAKNEKGQMVLPEAAPAVASSGK